MITLKNERTAEINSYLISYNGNNEEIERNPFYNSNNGYYSPSCDIEYYDKEDNLIQEIIINDEDVNK